jgi:putative ABC transport system ATP-binding protein
MSEAVENTANVEKSISTGNAANVETVVNEEIVIKVENLSREYVMKEHKVMALRNASLEVKAGEAVAIKGPSGSGKTTLLTLIGLLDVPTKGRIWIDGQEMTGIPDNKLHEIRQKKIGFVFQSFNLLPYLNAIENVELPMELSGLSPSARKEKAMKLLEEVGLKERALHKPSKLSAGEQQRVAIARALANDPKILLADEPTGNLDSKTKKEITRLFYRLRKERRMALVVVTHDSHVANNIGRVMVMRDGVLVIGKVGRITEDDDDDL